MQSECIEANFEKSQQLERAKTLLDGICTRGASVNEAGTIIFRPPGGVLSDMYYHFLFDGALMFFLWRLCNPGLDRPLTVSLPSSAPFASHFAAMFHDVDVRISNQEFPVGKHRVKGGKGPPLIRTELPAGFIEVRFPTVGASWGPHPASFSDAICTFRSHLLSQLDLSNLESPPMLTCVFRRTWAPAGKASNRRTIANEEEVRTALVATAAKHGLQYQEPVLETLDIWKQIAIFARAHVVVAQHGSALANVLWMPPPSHVIELGLPLPGSSFQALCNVCGVNWTSCCSPGPADGVLHVSTSELEAAIASCYDPQRTPS